MNKDDIKKALKFCADINDCDNCPYDVVRSCSDRLKLDARELITEQEKEIERLKDENTRLTENPYKRASDADKLKADIDRLNTIVERLDELLGKGINDYIMGIDGVEGIKDMWERSAVREFAEKLRKRLTENRVSNDNVVINVNYEIDELLKEYE